LKLSDLKNLLAGTSVNCGEVFDRFRETFEDNKDEFNIGTTRPEFVRIYLVARNRAASVLMELTHRDDRATRRGSGSAYSPPRKSSN
jgi:hypothetical protein